MDHKITQQREHMSDSEEEQLDTSKIGTMGPIVSSGLLNQSHTVNAWFGVPFSLFSTIYYKDISNDCG